MIFKPWRIKKSKSGKTWWAESTDSRGLVQFIHANTFKDLLEKIKGYKKYFIDYLQ